MTDVRPSTRPATRAAAPAIVPIATPAMPLRRRAVLAFGGLLAASPLLGSGTPAWSQDAAVTLFKIITVKDEIVIGLNRAELAALGGADAGAVARALAAKGELSAWQYGVRRGPNNEPQQAPTQKVGLLASSSLRVEPYTTPYPILPHE